VSDAHDIEHDIAPGDEAADEHELGGGVVGYTVGLGLAVLLTVVAFTLPTLDAVWIPSMPIALAVLAIAQMGVHVVFFLHVTTGDDNVNNVMALGFGALIVAIVIGGSVWVMHAMNMNMMPSGMHM
jgi:cytochrome o ubiquinol oxidase operon protein cyoD